MATEQEKKEFALSQLAPYYANPSTCGYDNEENVCEYLMPDGRMCVAGKNMITPKNGLYFTIDVLLGNDSQEGILKPEVVGILTNQEWQVMQGIHDTIAVHTNDIDKLKTVIGRLNLFTFEELEERAKTLK
jgi:hypothetical protein